MLKPTRQQAKKLLEWAGSYRWAYNWMVAYLEAAWKETGKTHGYCTEVRHKLQAAMPWFKTIPAHVVYGAMRDAEKDYKLVIAKRKQGQISELPRCRKHKQRSFYLLGNAVTSRGIYPRLLGQIRSAEPLPDKPADCRIVFEAGKFWLRFPYQAHVCQSESQGRVCAVDPGIRTFATVFSPGSLHKIGSGAFGRIARLATHLDDLISRTAQVSGAKRKRMRLAQARLRLKIRNLVEDLHYQTIGWLFRNFDIVVLPTSDFTSAVKKVKRKIRAKSVRSLLTFAFAKFRDRLKFKAELLGKTVVLVCESYTSKTHNLTGEVRNIGGAKSVTSRGLRIDRDINGALGILLKALLAQPGEKSLAPLSGVNVQ